MTKDDHLNIISEVVSEYPNLANATEVLNARNILTIKGKQWTLNNLQMCLKRHNIEIPVKDSIDNQDKFSVIRADVEVSESHQTTYSAQVDDHVEYNTELAQTSTLISSGRSVAEMDQLDIDSETEGSGSTQEVVVTSQIKPPLATQSVNEEVIDTAEIHACEFLHEGRRQVNNTMRFTRGELISLRKLIELEQSGNLHSLLDWYLNTANTTALVAASRPNLRGPRSNTGIKVSRELLKLAKVKFKEEKWRSLNQLIENLLWQLVDSPNELLE